MNLTAGTTTGDGVRLGGKRVLATTTVLAAMSALFVGTGETTAAAWPAASPSPSAASTTHLPLDPYWVSDSVVNQISQAEAALRLTCMHRLGFTDLPTSYATVLPASWHPMLGQLSLRSAAKNGYLSMASGPQEETTVAIASVKLENRPATSMQTAAMNGYRSSVNGHPVPRDGCWGQAQRELQGNTGGLRADPRAAAFVSELKALSNQHVLTAFARWSACMRVRGFHYRTPVDAERDPRWARTSAAGTSYPDHATPAEVATASADATCRQRVGLAHVWQYAEARYERQLIAKEGRQLSMARSVAAQWIANARGVATGKIVASVHPVENPGSAVSPDLTWNGPYTYSLLSGLGYLANSCYCSYDGDPVDIFKTYYQGPADWWVSDPITNGYRIMASAEGTPTIWAISDHDLSTKPGSGIYLWKVYSPIPANQEVYVGLDTSYGTAYYIRDRFSSLYVSLSYTSDTKLAWEKWGYEGPDHEDQLWH